MKKLFLMAVLCCFAAAPAVQAQEPVTVPQTQTVNDLKKQQEKYEQNAEAAKKQAEAAKKRRQQHLPYPVLPQT